MKTMKVELTFAEPILGSTPCSQDALRKYIASRSEDPAKEEEECSSVEETEEVQDNTLTVFPREDGKPFTMRMKDGEFQRADAVVLSCGGRMAASIEAAGVPFTPMRPVPQSST